MTDPTNVPNEPDEADPGMTSALRTLDAPDHGYGFWANLEARFAAEPVDQPAPPPPPAALSPEPPAEPPLAEVVPLSRRRGPGRWLLAAAAALVAVAGIAAVTRGDDTKLETTPAGPTPTVETTTSLPVTSVAPPEPSSVPPTGPKTVSTVPVAPGTSKSSVSPTTVRRSTTTTRPASLALSPAGVGPLRLGMTPQQAAATGALGRYQVADPTSPSSCGQAPAGGAYRSSDFSALFVDNKLVRFYVDGGSRLATPQGVRIGSPPSMLSSVPGTRSEAPHPYDEAATDVTFMSGGVGYQFTLNSGSVTRWSVGTRAGLDLKEGCS